MKITVRLRKKNLNPSVVLLASRVRHKNPWCCDVVRSVHPQSLFTRLNRAKPSSSRTFLETWRNYTPEAPPRCHVFKSETGARFQLVEGRGRLRCEEEAVNIGAHLTCGCRLAGEKDRRPVRLKVSKVVVTTGHNVAAGRARRLGSSAFQFSVFRWRRA